MRSGWIAAGATVTLVISGMHTLGGMLRSPEAEMAAVFAAMDGYRPGGEAGPTMLDVLRALGLAFGLLIAIPALQCLTAVFRRESSEAHLRSLAIWNTVWAVCLTAIMAAFEVVPGIFVFASISVLFGASLIPRSAASP